MIIEPRIDTDINEGTSNFWDFHMKQRKVEPLTKPCKDCAITTGFYTEIADELKLESKEIVQAVVDTWFCHNNCNRGCAGIREYMRNSLPKSQE